MPSCARPPFQHLAHPVVVGVGCHVHGIRSLERLKRGPLSHRPLVLGLICAGVYSFHKIDHLRSVAGVADGDGDFQGLRYRDKGAYGWPGDVSVYSRGHAALPQEVRHRAKEAFLHPRCSLCFDQMNVLSDITFGDPWGISADRDGWTVILTRTEAGQAALDDAIAAGALTVEPVDAEAVFAGQEVDSRHRPEWLLKTAAWREMGLPAPDFGFSVSARRRGRLRPHAEVSPGSFLCNRPGQ